MFIKVIWAHFNVIYVTFQATTFKITEILLNSVIDKLPSKLSGLKYNFQKTSNGPLYSCEQFVLPQIL